MITPHQTTLGLGLAALGRPGYINLGHANDLQRNYDVAAMQQRAHEVLDAAWASGIRYFDAARSYGRAEQFLAEWLKSRQIDRDEVTVGSKWGYTYTADWNVTLPAGQAHEVKQHSLDRLNEQLTESQALLGDQLNLYQIHSATLESGVLNNDAVLARLAQLRDQGLRIGLSVSGIAQAEVIRRAIDCEHDGRQIFSAVQATWNLLERSAGQALQRASDCGWKVIVKEGVANGRLTERNNEADFANTSRHLRTLADQHEVSIDAVALAAVLKQPWSSIVLSGAASCEQLASNVRALQLTARISADEIEQLVSDIGETPSAYWQTRSSLAWN